MSARNTLLKLDEEIKGKNRKEVIQSYEEILSKNIEDLSKNDFFFNLPLQNILSIISKVNFNKLKENSNDILENVIKNTIKMHFEEKETILLLQNINKNTISLFSYENILSIMKLITNCPILVKFCKLYNEQLQLPVVDYEYEIQQKDKEIERLKKYSKKVNQTNKDNLVFDLKKVEFTPIMKKPNMFLYVKNIFTACKYDKLPSVQWLIEKENVDPNIRIDADDNRFEFYAGSTPLHIASQNGNLQIVEYLIYKGAEIDAKNKLERTPLHYACINKHLKIVEYLISNGADLNSKDEYGDSLLHFASHSDFLQIVQYLIELQHFDVDIKNKNEQTPLHYACMNGRLTVVKYLIAHGANIEAKDNAKINSGSTPLHIASYYGKIEVVKYLLSIGANKDAKTNSGYTPYDLATNEEIRKLLL